MNLREERPNNKEVEEVTICAPTLGMEQDHVLIRCGGLKSKYQRFTVSEVQIIMTRDYECIDLTGCPSFVFTGFTSTHGFLNAATHQLIGKLRS